MAGRLDAARAALRNVPMLHEGFIEPALRELDAAGLLDSERSGNGGFARVRATSQQSDRTTQETVHELRANSVRTMMAAAEADRRNVELLRQIHANARRLGVGALFNDYSKPVDAEALDVALRDKPIADRWRFKEMLYCMKLIPA